MDWTSLFDQRKANELCNKVIDQLLEEMSEIKLSTHNDLSLDKNEIIFNL